MGEKRREKNRLTRQSMLTLIGKSEEEFKNIRCINKGNG